MVSCAVQVWRLICELPSLIPAGLGILGNSRGCLVGNFTSLRTTAGVVGNIPIYLALPSRAGRKAGINQGTRKR